jgi:predicted dehydrogenase
MDRVQVFGPKGSLLATGHELFYRPKGSGGAKMPLDGGPVTLEALPRQTSNPVSYFVDRVRHGKVIEDPLSAKLNVQVMEILDAARQSARTGRQQDLR